MNRTVRILLICIICTSFGGIVALLVSEHTSRPSAHVAAPALAQDFATGCRDGGAAGSEPSADHDHHRGVAELTAEFDQPRGRTGKCTSSDRRQALQLLAADSGLSDVLHPRHDGAARAVMERGRHRYGGGFG